MNTVSFGPFALSGDLLALIIALISALIVGSISARGRDLAIVDTLLRLALAGVVAARLVFVMRYWGAYAANPMTILDIRDSGFDAIGGLLGMAACASAVVSRRPQMRRPLGMALVAGALSWGASSSVLHLMDSTPLQRPQARLQTLAGTTTTLDALAQAHPGAPMVVNLWASWCPPCRAEMPMLAAAQRERGDVIFVFANQGESAAVIERFLRAESLAPAHVLVDRGQQLARTANARAFPTTLFFDAEGRLVNHHLGILSRATLAHALEQMPPATPTNGPETR